MKPEHREIAIRTGRELERRVVEEKAAGQIRDYFVFSDSSDPEIITHIQIVKVGSKEHVKMER
jgi:hypothetical protein